MTTQGVLYYASQQIVLLSVLEYYTRVYEEEYYTIEEATVTASEVAFKTKQGKYSYSLRLPSAATARV